jgi:hypothetical protein
MKGTPLENELRETIASLEEDLATAEQETRDAYDARDETQAELDATLDDTGPALGQNNEMRDWLWEHCDPNQPYSKAWDLWLPLAQADRSPRK